MYTPAWILYYYILAFREDISNRGKAFVTYRELWDVMGGESLLTLQGPLDTAVKVKSHP